METIILFHNSKWYNPIWALLFTLCLVLLWVYRKRWEKGYDAFFWFIIVSIGVVYCPLLANILVPRFLPSYAEYERLSWIFFEVPLISYVLIKLAMEIKNKKKCYLFVACFLVLFVFIGSPDNRVFYQKPENKYRVSQDAITICDKLDELSPKGPIVLCVQLENARNYQTGSGLDGMLYYGIRTYGSRFRLQYVDIHPERYEEGEFTLNEELSENIDYYLCPKVEKIYQELVRRGYAYVDESENFAIFRNQLSEAGDDL